MIRTSAASLSGIFGITLMLTSIGRIGAQEPVSSPQTSGPTTAQEKIDQPTAATDDKKTASSPKPPQSAGVAPSVPWKKGQPYTGPTTVIQLAPTPMLDEEGKQRQDPDGKLMFNPPVKQQRDKFGHPLFDQKGQPVMQTKDNLGFDENGKKIHPVKEKPPKLVSVSISRGILTIDGLTGKAALNYEIKDLKYIYIYVPGVGTTVISKDPFPGAVEQKRAFDDKTLTVSVGEHVMQISSENRLLGKNPESAYVMVDKYFSAPAKFPVMGYGPIRVAPYAWPGSKVNEQLKGEIVEAPPLPKDLRPTLLLQPCPAGQMRQAAPPALPGQTAAPQPCVPIAQATKASLTATPATNTPAANTSTNK